MMKRREFIAGLGSAAIQPATGHAQQPTIPVVGFLGMGTRDAAFVDPEVLAAIRRGLAEMGYVEGRNLNIEYRGAEGHLERQPELAADLVRRRVALIVVVNDAAALAAKAATSSIPIAFAVGADPVEIGLVPSLNRPSGNLTGIYQLDNEVAAKRLEFLHEIVPAATSIAYLANPANPVAEAEAKEIRTAAQTLGVSLLTLYARDASELEVAFAALVRQHAGGLVVGNEPLFFRFPDHIIAFAVRQKVPTMFAYREHVVAGGLASYGTDHREAWRQIGVYAGRILKGEKPGDLPVQQVTKLDLVINLKTAKTLGLTIPETLLATADEVIQ